MRFLLFLVLLGGIGYVLHQRQAGARPDAGPGRHAYAETRLKMRFDNGRELDMVMADENPPDQMCATGNKDIPIPAACSTPGVSCKLGDMVCMDAVPPRYAGMLAGKPQQNAYIHLLERSSGRRGILVAWGSTAEETRAMCGVVLQRADRAKMEVRCL